MAVYVSNIVVDCGIDFSTTFGLEDITTNSYLNLVGYGVSAQMRKHYGSSSSVSFASTISDPLGGKITISLTDTETSQIKPGRYVYDVILTANANDKKYKAVEGMALVRAGVTR
ncbi:MAG: hypothetical protein EBS55_09050 [Flavobacteriaceae bacterium]|jgi:hypothetical protein|nr:hypothetical protein [Flavobacteriaceae bacterium]